jgi:hypothetical protein
MVTVKCAQTMQNTANYSVTAYLSSTTQVVVERKGNVGAIVCYVTVLKCSVDVVIQRLTNVTLNNGVTNITIDSNYPRGKKFLIYQVLTAGNLLASGITVTTEITTDSNLKVTTVSAGLFLYGYVVFIPDAVVHHLNGTVSGTSSNINIASLGIDRTKTFSFLSFIGTAGSILTMDKHKSAFITSDTNVNLRSYVSSNATYSLQLVMRQNNFVRRVLTEVAPSSYDVFVSGTIDFTKSFCFLVGLFNRLSEANTTSNNFDNFGFTVTPATPDKVVLEKYNSGATSMCSMELVEMGSISIQNTSLFRRLTIRSL